MEPQNDIDNLTIELPEAIERTSLWRQKFMETFAGTESNDVFRGFLIPIADILDIAAKFPAGTVTHVRAYISAEENAAEGSVKLSTILVPARTLLGGNPDTPVDEFTYTDEEGVVKSTIYDFTQPCPPCCDHLSPLHDRANRRGIKD